MSVDDAAPTTIGALEEADAAGESERELRVAPTAPPTPPASSAVASTAARVREPPRVRAGAGSGVTGSAGAVNGSNGEVYGGSGVRVAVSMSRF